MVKGVFMSSTFITEDFLLQNSFGKKLYHEYAAGEPIYDYHCHLAPDQVALNRPFRNLYDIWLAGDHYKWRAMRSNGVKEHYCTGAASDWEKFQAFAQTVPQTLRNPIYHWTHLELLRYFGIKKLLNGETAQEIWDEANEKLQSPEFTPQGILEKCQVRVVCTTDDPTDTLEHHDAVAAGACRTALYPTFRPDKALQVDKPELFLPWVEKLEKVSGISCADFAGLVSALKSRHDFFHARGGRLSDHGLESCYAEPCGEEEAAVIYARVRAGERVSILEQKKFATLMMVLSGRWDAARGWTKQLHLGALRNNNSRLYRAVGPDIGCDSMGDFPQAVALSRYLDLLDATGELPQTVLYNLNPADNYVFGTMIGNFQDGSRAGKMQLGSGWWFLDQKEGMEWQINALSSLGLLSRFVGMLTDSRSFLSYTRHEYFRRILCNLIGRDVEQGELPRDEKLLGNLVKDVCYRNARDFFGLALKA
jgi:glucuronate isomerase